MKFSRSALSLGAIVLGLGAVSVWVGCGSDSSSSGNSTGSTTDSTLGKPPALEEGATKTSSTDRHVFAVQQVFLGDTNRDGSADPKNAWRQYGYNLDGLVSSRTSKDVCTPAKNGSVIEDGDDGIDNSFGQSIYPTIVTFASDATQRLNKSIADGSFTIMFDTTGLTGAATQTNSGLFAQVLAGGEFDPDAKPTFTTADNWPVRPEILTDGKTIDQGSKVQFKDAYITNGTFVNGNTPATIKLSLVISGISLDLNIRQAIVTFENSGKGSLTNGTIAGVLDTKELVDGIRKIAGRISSNLCEGSTIESVIASIEQASDIMSDGTNVAGTPCDAISVGLGFTAKEIGVPTKIGDIGEAGDDPCNPTEEADAGTGDAN